MNTLNYLLAAGLFSAGQIAAIVIVSILFVGLLALNGYIIYLMHKRGIHKLQTKKLQQQREALMQKLNDMRSGKPFEFSARPVAATSAADADDEKEEQVDDDSEDAEDEILEEEESVEVAVVEETGSVVRYNRSFIARITQADGDLKARYSELKNYLLSFKGVRSRMSWKHEIFQIGRQSVAGFIVRGKTLCLKLATDPALFADTKYKVDDVSGRNNNSLPCLFRIKSDRRTGYAKELIDVVMAGFDSERNEEYKAADFTLPYKSTEVLLKQRLIKIIGGKVAEFDREEALAAAKGITYNRSFTARIIQSDDSLKAQYSKLKNYLLTYDVSSTYSWKRENFKFGRNCVAAIAIRGKTLCLYLAADPKTFDGTKYKVEDYSLRSKNTNTPLMYRIKSDRKMAYALQLIDKVFGEQQIGKVEHEEIDYVVPFTATETLIRRGLIRVSEDKGGNPFARAREEGAVRLEADNEAAVSKDEVVKFESDEEDEEEEIVNSDLENETADEEDPDDMHN